MAKNSAIYPLSDHMGGLTCDRCDRDVLEGQPYAQVFDGLAGDGTPILLCVCVYCAGPVT